MSRSASRTQNSVSLFPFLAVLVCAMGALIFLLLVTTRRIRDEARRQIESERVAVVAVTTPAPAERTRPFVPPLPGPRILAPPPVEPPRPEPEPEVVPEPVVDLRPAVVAAPAPRPVPPPDPNVELRRIIRTLEDAVAERRERANRARETLASGESDRAELDATLARMTGELAERRRELAALLDSARDLQVQRAATEQTRNSIGERLRRERAKPDEPASEFAFVPYDGTKGTNRRPIYIECVPDGLRFLPEGQLLTEEDLVGFTYAFNPLLAGTRVLVEHWHAVDLRETPRHPRPYVLLLVRPGGEGAYYAARKLLERLGEPFGYEIVPADLAIALPDPDPIAQRLVRDETNRLLAERDRAAEQVRSLAGGRGGSGGRGGANSGSGSLDRGTFGGGGGGFPGDAESDADDGPKIVGGIRPPVGIGARPVGLSGGGRGGSEPPPGGHLVREYPRRANGTAVGERSDDAFAPDDSPAPENNDRTAVARGPSGRERAAGNRVPEGRFAPPDDPAFAPEGMRGSGERSPLSTPAGRRVYSGGLIDSEAERTDDVFPKQDEPSPLDGSRPDDVFARATHGHPAEFGGGHPAVRRSGIGFERSVTVEVFDDRLVVNDRYTLPFERGQTAEELASAVVRGVERSTADWGQPPRGFHWVPAVRFRVRPGGNVHYERIHSRLQRSRLKTSVEYALEANDDAQKPQ